MRHTVLVIPEGGGELWHAAGPAIAGSGATWSARSLLSAEAGANTRTTREIVWSGSFAEVEGGGLFDEDPRTWGIKGWDAMRERIEARGGAGNGLVIRSHARHVVSDVPGCRRLLESSWSVERGVSLCYDPASMLSPTMMDRAEDHLRRMYEAIELFPVERLGMVVVAGLGEEGASGELAARLAAAWVPVGVPIAILDGNSVEATDWLSDANA